MAISSEVIPAYVLRAYIWGVLKANDPGTWDVSNYGGLTPIVPVAEEPELSQYDGPHIVYGYANSGTGSLPARRGGSMTLAVYDSNFRRLSKTLSILEHALGRRDETARDVNRFSTNRSPFIGLRFGYIAVGFVEGGTPEDTEGGNQSGLININFEYYTDHEGIITQIP